MNEEGNILEGECNKTKVPEEVLGVYDPEEATMKEAPKKSQSTPKRKNKCRTCKRFGHNSRKCELQGKSHQSKQKNGGSWAGEERKGQNKTYNVGLEELNFEDDEPRSDFEETADVSV